MNFDIIPKAEASVESFINTINKVVINPIIYFLFSLGTILFLFGIVRFFLNPTDETIRKESKNHMVWGLIGMFIMVSVFGIMNLIVKTIGA
ncbi:MAG TPA: hypothetical protein PL034_00500 [Candidatus Paceibacterota bacterium]|jgi:uncharacterized membrane protein|nr:hypothetical protein [Candidatus Paceibacterota bacterium]HPI82622.1 hypothetical protein [Candidatus Paceibacterota bacterium]HPK14330.1 hypothetical protein [Candidatus Paceibacterota bacterium]HPR84024.1 hypothetical protein [Candidatus Paceibacterota bacterium]